MTYEVMDYMPQAEYTVQLGSLISNGYDLGMVDYPIFNERYRTALNAKIYEHYWFREIGQETPALFKRFLNRKMNEIMPYYNELYESMLIEFNPLINVDMTTTEQGSGLREDKRDNKHTEATDGYSDSSSNTKAESRAVISNTPQMQLSGRDDYATSLTDSISNSDVSSAGHDSSKRTLEEIDALASKETRDFITHTAGLSGITGSRAIQEYREAIINVDMMVIEELAPLFMGVFNPFPNVM